MARKLGKALSLLLVLIIIAAYIGCGEKGLEEASFDAQEVADDALAAQVDVESCRMDMDMRLDAEGEAEGERMEMTMSIDASGVVDQANEEMEMEMSMNMRATGEEAVAVDMEMYLVGDYLYTKVHIAGEEPDWIKQRVPADYWETQATVDQQIELLRTAQVEPLGYQKVRGVDCYVLELTPDLDELWQTMTQLPSMEELLEGMPNLEDVITEMSVKEWIAKDTSFLTKAQIIMSMHMTPEDVGMPEEEGEITMSIEMDIVAYDYNEPVSIELPPEAEGAEEVPFL